MLQPNDPDALYDRARLLVHLGQYKRAADVLSNLLEQRPTDAGIARRLAQCLHRLSQPQKAAAVLEGALWHAEQAEASGTEGTTGGTPATGAPGAGAGAGVGGVEAAATGGGAGDAGGAGGT